MNLFGEMADTLTELIEEIDDSPFAGEAKALQKTLQRAYENACIIDRIVRHRDAVDKLPIQ